MLETVSTPCIGVCTTDENGVCMGCFRTGDEIASWGSISEPERLKVMSALAERKEAYFA